METLVVAERGLGLERDRNRQGTEMMGEQEQDQNLIDSISGFFSFVFCWLELGHHDYRVTGERDDKTGPKEGRSIQSSSSSVRPR